MKRKTGITITHYGKKRTTIQKHSKTHDNTRIQNFFAFVFTLYSSDIS